MMFLDHAGNAEWIPHHVSLQLVPNGILDFQNPVLWLEIKLWFSLVIFLVINFTAQIWKKCMEIARFERFRKNRYSVIPSFSSNSFWARRKLNFWNVIFLWFSHNTAGQSSLKLIYDHPEGLQNFWLVGTPFDSPTRSFSLRESQNVCKNVCKNRHLCFRS